MNEVASAPRKKASSRSRAASSGAGDELIENRIEDGKNPFGLMTMEEVAAALGKDRMTIKNWVVRREIPFITIGNKAMFRRASVMAWLLEKECKPRGSY